MHKLCSLKDVVPGSVIELPRGYRAKVGETAILLDLSYNKKQIRAEFLKKQGEDFVTVEMPATNEDEKLALVDDDKLQKAATEAFVSGKVVLPDLPMSTGCDPEIFVVHEDDSVFPAWEFMPSEQEAQKNAKQWLTERVPFKTMEGTYNPGLGTESSNHCPEKVPAYWDGAQAEFAPWAKNCLETLHYGTRTGLKSVLEFARLKDPKAKLTLRNVVTLPDSVLKNAANELIQFRCSPSLNVYNDPGEAPQDARQYKFRCAGGHIHIGYSRAFTAPGIEQIVRGLDGVLGVIGVSLAAGIDDPERRHTYGRAGEFRLPKHGMEYRVLLNFWLSHPAIAMLIFEIARVTVRFAESGLYNLCWQASEEEIREVINECDVQGARTILKRNIVPLTGLINNLWINIFLVSERDKMKALALKTVLNGMDAAIKDPFDIEGNWKINRPDDWKAYCRGEGDSWRSLATC